MKEEIFSEEEKAAMRDYVQEKKGRRKGIVDEEPAVLAKFAEMPEPDRAIGERIHAIVKAARPELKPRLWYGMPAYTKDGKTICFFQSASKFKTRYCTLGFMHEAQLDEGNMWPTAFAILNLGPAEEARIKELLKKALS